MNRRGFLVNAGLAVGAGSLAGRLPSSQAASAPSPPPAGMDTWQMVRDQFILDPNYVHMSGFLLAPHPKPVRDAIERHRRGFDENPVDYLHEHMWSAPQTVRRAASAYLDCPGDNIALTDSTTMGLGLLYGSLTLKPGREILTTVHDHYSTDMSIRHRAERTGCTVKQIPLYRDIHSVTVDEIVETLVGAVTPKTRIIAVTWVHSSTGLKLPIRAMADALAELNAGRDAGDRALLCVDGVHGLGVEDDTQPSLGCDFLIAGTHKWLFGPRGTGLVCGTADAWTVANPTIPTFEGPAYGMWMQVIPEQPVAPGHLMTPGGFHSFEHRWAVNEAFKFHQAIGKSRVEERIHALNRRLKQGLREIDHVTLITPPGSDLSSGITCFEVDGLAPDAVVDRLRDERRILASVTPYATRYVRLAPGLLTTEEDVDVCLHAVEGLLK